MFCYNCGNKLVDGAKFCAFCGKPVIIPDRTPQPPVSPFHTNQVPPAVNVTENVQQDAPPADEDTAEDDALLNENIAEEETAEDANENEAEEETAEEDEEIAEEESEEESEEGPEALPVSVYAEACEEEESTAEEQNDDAENNAEAEEKEELQNSEQADSLKETPDSQSNTAAYSNHCVKPSQQVYANNGYHQNNSYNSAENSSASQRIEFKQKKEKKSKPKKYNAIKKQSPFAVVLSVLLTLILFAMVLATSVIMLVRAIVSEDNVDSVIDSVTVSDIDISIVSKENETVGEAFYDFCQGHSVWSALSKKEAKSFINKPFLKEFAKNIVADYRDYFIEGEAKRGITPAKIISFLEDNEPMFRSTLKKAGVEGEIVFNFESQKENLENSIGNSFDTKMWGKRYEPLMTLLRFIFSDMGVISLCAVTALFAGLIFITNKRRISNSFVYIAVPTGFFAVVYCVGAIALKILFETKSDSVLAIASRLVSVPLLNIGLVMLGAFVLLIVAKIIGVVIRKKRFTED